MPRAYRPDEWATIVDLIREHAPWRPYPQVLTDAEFMVAWLNTFEDLEARAQLSKENLLAWWQSTEEYKNEAEKPTPEPEPDRPPVQPLVGKVRISGRGFADDAGPFLGVTATHMDAINLIGRDPHRFEDNIDFLSSMGMSQRVLGILGWAGDQRLDPRAPDYWDRAEAVVVKAYERGVRTQFTVFADLFFVNELHSQQARREHARRFVERFRDKAHMFLCIEGCNEPGNGDLWSRYGTPEDLLEVTKIVGEGLGLPWAPGALYGGNDSTTAWWLREGEYSEEAKKLIAGAPAVSMHLDRGTGAEGLWRPVRQPWDARGTAGSKMWWDNEPVGFDSSVTWFNDENQRNRTAMRPDYRTLARIAAMHSWMCGAALYCWHTEGGTGYSSERPLRGEPGAAEVMAARAVLPADLPNFDKHNWHWSSNPVETIDGCVYDRGMKGRGTLRTISATAGGRVVIHPIAILEGATFRARYGMVLDKLEYHDGQYRKTAELDLAAGQTWNQESAFDVLYVGRFK